MGQILEFLGEDYAAEVRAFVDRWPIVHKVVADESRPRLLSAEQRQSLWQRHTRLAAVTPQLRYGQLVG